MKNIRTILNVAALLVLALCITAAYFCGLFTKIEDASYYPFGWYFIAKGLFCSVSLYISGIIIDKLSEISKK